ncbi:MULTISPECIES: hypothetical protein [unclassified Desulfovibrio]
MTAFVARKGILPETAVFVHYLEDIAGDSAVSPRAVKVLCRLNAKG